MPGKPRSTCRACGNALAPHEQICPRCRVPRKGDTNRPMIAAYFFFLFVAFVAGAITIAYLRNVQHIQ